MKRFLVVLLGAALLTLALVGPAFAGGSSFTKNCVSPLSRASTWTLAANGDTSGGSLTIDACTGSTIVLGGGP